MYAGLYCSGLFWYLLSSIMGRDAKSSRHMVNGVHCSKLYRYRLCFCYLSTTMTLRSLSYYNKKAMKHANQEVGIHCGKKAWEILTGITLKKHFQSKSNSKATMCWMEIWVWCEKTDAIFVLLIVHWLFLQIKGNVVKHTLNHWTMVFKSSSITLTAKEIKHIM